MRFYEVFVADSRYHASTPLTYSSEEPLAIMSVVMVPLRARLVPGFVVAEVDLPQFKTKPVRSVVSRKSMPAHTLGLARWISEYYAVNLGETLRQFGPAKAGMQHTAYSLPNSLQQPSQLEFESPLTKDQRHALDQITKNPSTTVLLHGVTGSGKTRVYLELAKTTLRSGRSVILLTPEIALTPQLSIAVSKQLHAKTLVLHSQLTQAQRKQIWLSILESDQPVVVIGPRSALFSPVHNLGLIVLDEAHEPAYKQDQSPRYHAVRVASQLGLLTQAKVVLGSATPALTDYYIAKKHGALVEMKRAAIASQDSVSIEVVDLKNKKNFSKSPHLSNQLLKAIGSSVNSKKQALIYLNRRGTARLILCNNCGWQMLCPNCDTPMVYHGDTHNVRCHICGFHSVPPAGCPQCQNPDIIYNSIGTKALVDEVRKHFPNSSIQRFDSDNSERERLEQIYNELLSGKTSILIGTQLLAKGLDLPRLGLVGIVAAETSLALPDFSSEERGFQLLYQVIGRVGRGHSKGHVVLQTYEPNSVMVQAAVKRDWSLFYNWASRERQQFRFPPFSFLMQLTCRRATLKGVEQASNRLKKELLYQSTRQRMPVEIVGPAPAFYSRRGKYYYWQIVVKSKNRDSLLQLSKIISADWSINLDPINLL